MAELRPDLSSRAKRTKLLLMDCDGVLTDGRLYFGPTGEDLKVFDVRDGQGLVNWHRAGYRSGIISGRASPIVDRRATELGIEFVRQGVDDKAAVFAEIVAFAGVAAEETAYVGDDVGDLPAMALAGLSFAVADAVEEVKATADHVTARPGGRGAVREIIDLLLAARR